MLVQTKSVVTVAQTTTCSSNNTTTNSKEGQTKMEKRAKEGDIICGWGAVRAGRLDSQTTLTTTHDEKVAG